MAPEIDVLIVFSDRDNQVSGWVTSLKTFLDPVLQQVMGRKPNIILKSDVDTMSSPNLDNAGVLVAVLTKEFVQSNACQEYLQKFTAATHSTSKILNRTFKVLKTPLSTNEQPAGVQSLFGYEMYQIDADTGESKDFADFFSDEAQQQYWMELIDLSYDIYETLYYLQEGKAISEIRKIYGGKTIYLAQTSHDLTVQRNIIYRELQRLGYTVLPSITLPGKLSEFEQAVKSDLAKSSLSIHLIGSHYGEIPAGGDRSGQEIQHRLSAERGIAAKAKNVAFHRLIWIAPEVAHSGELQRKFIDTLARDAETSEDAEILQTPLEDFKTIIREELEESIQKKPIEEGNGRTIYLMHDKIDDNAVKPYIELIRSAGFDVLTPDFEGELIALRKKHIENLRKLDGAVIFKGKVNEQWVRMKMLDLLKAPGFGRKRPIVGKVIVSGGDPIVNKEPFKRQDLRVIEGDQQQSLESLRSFLKEFKT
ncbi:MAG: hypothetical protein ABJA70_03080 [Chryseolinea sp.]